MDHINLKLVIAIARTYNQMFTKIEESLKPEGMTTTEFGVLEHLYHKGKQPVQNIAEKILVTSGTITYIIDKLEKRGLVERIRCVEDKRVFYVALTPEGETLISGVFKRHEDMLERLFSDLTLEQKENIHLDLVNFQKVISKERSNI